jgi:hypothetical protein
VKPKIAQVPLATGLRWRGGGDWQFTQKFDGRYHELDAGAHLIACELMRDGTLWAFDCLRAGGEDVSGEPLTVRWRELHLAVNDAIANMHVEINIVPAGQGGEFLESVLAHGGEGVVAKPWLAPFGSSWLKCKRQQVFQCRVVGLNLSTGGAKIIDDVTGEDRGTVPLRNRAPLAKFGSIVKVVGYGLTARGMIREPRPDSDSPESWLIHY